MPLLINKTIYIKFCKPGTLKIVLFNAIPVKTMQANNTEAVSSPKIGLHIKM